MVIDSNWPAKTNSSRQTIDRRDEHLGQFHLASPFDRLAAAVIDWILIATPILVTVLAPIKREAYESLIFEADSRFAVAAILSAVVIIVSSYFYQTVMIYRFGATFGKMAMGLKVIDIWNHKNPDWSAASFRTLIWMGEVLLAGLPWITVFAHPLRRSFHDRLSDTVVVAKKHKAVRPPHAMEAAFIRGIYAAVAVLVLLIAAVVVDETIKGIEARDQVFAWLKHEAKGEALCESVDAPPGKRLETAMALFAAGLADQECLKTEADHVLNNVDDQSALAYLAKAFAHSDEPELSNDYLEKVCSLDEEADTCQLTKIVQNWSDDSDEKVRALFQKLANANEPYILVWRLRYAVREAQYEEALALINQLGGTADLAEYLIPERVKALWRSSRIEDARLVAMTAFESLNSEVRSQLGSWLCYQEMTRQCGAVTPLSCSLIGDEPATSVAVLSSMLVEERCDPENAKVDYARIAEEMSEGAMKSFLNSLEDFKLGHIQEAKAAITQVLLEDGADETLRGEALRRLLMWSNDGQESRDLVAKWQTLKSQLKADLGPALFEILKNKGETELAVNLGREYLNEHNGHTEMKRHMVVATYELGKKKEAWGLLKSLRQQADVVGSERSPASSDPFVVISRSLEREFSKP